MEVAGPLGTPLGLAAPGSQDKRGGLLRGSGNVLWPEGEQGATREWVWPLRVVVLLPNPPPIPVTLIVVDELSLFCPGSKLHLAFLRPSRQTQGLEAEARREKVSWSSQDWDTAPPHTLPTLI